MKIKVAIQAEPDAKLNRESDAAKQTIQVETHSRRGDIFNVDKNETVMEGDEKVFIVPTGGRLMLTTPQTNEELVYDKEQGASVRASLQKNDEGRADSAAPPAPTRVAATGPTANANNTPQLQRPSMQAPAAPTPATTAPKPGEAGSNKPDPSTGKMHPQDVAKQQQQNSVHPAGEKPPLPGSPVGSPPAGNEGKDNK